MFFLIDSNIKRILFSHSDEIPFATEHNKPMKQNYKVNELFQTIQGEGFYTGVPAIQDCDVGYAWCLVRH